MQLGEQQILELRKEYGAIEKMDPSSELYQNLIAFLDTLAPEKLQMLADGQIKWLSMLANNRLTRRAMGIK